MLYAQRLALKFKIPLHICFCLVPKFLDATIRHYDFMLKGNSSTSIKLAVNYKIKVSTLGLQEVQTECKKLNIEFHLVMGESRTRVPELVEKLKLDAVVTDFSPLRVPRSWVETVTENLPHNIPFCQVNSQL